MATENPDASVRKSVGVNAAPVWSRRASDQPTRFRRRAGDHEDRRPSDSSPARLEHYPAGLIDVWRLKNGARLMIRPVLPQDSALLGRMIVGLSHTTRRNRFHGVVNDLSDQALRQMTCVDYQRHLALVILQLEADQEKLIAEARYAVDEQGDGAEFAIVVDDQWCKRGLGKRAMQVLVHAARKQGLSWLYGSVLSTNAPMKSLMKSCEFLCTEDREDEQLLRVEKRLDGADTARVSAGSRQWARRWLGFRTSTAHL